MSQDLTASKGGIIVVSFGVEKWTTTVAAGSLFEAVRKAWEFFHDPFWQGPKPTLDTMFDVNAGGEQRTYRTTPRKAGCAVRN